ncbi:MAG: bifunctional biotin--[acetyl-CoA-carboxylase] ligase/biotin operon repressor BirA [Arsenophonus endosymbiont of Ceratovacuna japonica]
MKDKIIILKLIKILSDGNIYSVKKLSKLVSICQSSINKYINILHKYGIEFNSDIIGHNYKLTKKIDLLNYNQIYNLMKYGNLIVKPIIDSTNQFLLNYIDKLSIGDVCIAEYQTHGRGRRNRYWHSPFGYNLYLSIYWHLKQRSSNIMGLSLVIGIVIAETINKLSGTNNIKVKWPNDLYLNEKKLAGILIETVSRNSNESHIVIGIGLNIAMNYNYKTNVNQRWINLEQAGIKIEKNIIAGHIILALRYELLQFEKYGLIHFIKRWLVLDNFLNKKIILHIGNHIEIGIMKGINEYGAILLEQNGKIISYIGVEISLKSEDNYNYLI